MVDNNHEQRTMSEPVEKATRNDERNRGGTRDAFKVVLNIRSGSLRLLRLYLADHDREATKKSSCSFLGIRNLRRVANAWYVKERGGLALQLPSFDYLSPFFSVWRATVAISFRDILLTLEFLTEMVKIGSIFIFDNLSKYNSADVESCCISSDSNNFCKTYERMLDGYLAIY